ncbi:hypothetical protein [Henriciella litoralis]|uniref:hypothetical protein n=1 Tax=Henriciella litoralis TaxID=568102 RepID=UPI00111C0B5F|nr:hypothetical protein [Henriciella litoralis]
MSDKIFFFGAFLVAILLVTLALLPGMNQMPTGPVSGGNTDYTRIEISGDQLNRMVAGGASDISLERVDGQTVLRIEVEADTLSEDPLRGPHFVLAADLETVFADRKLKITVRARAADRYGAEGIRINYAVGNAESSGWQDFGMTREFQDVSFEYILPPRNVGSEQGYDYLAIRPEVPEKQRAVYVQSVIFEPIGPPRSAVAP